VTAYFLDSSALVKRNVPETGTVWVRSIITPSTSNTILVARMMQVSRCRLRRPHLRHPRHRSATPRELTGN
jgi:uncharacterized protein